VGGVALLRPRLALPAPGLSGGPRPVPTSSPVSQTLVPMLAGYLLIMTALGSGLYFLARPKAGDRHAGSRRAGRPDGWTGRARPRDRGTAGSRWPGT